MLATTPVVLLMARIVVLAVVLLILRFASTASQQAREFDLWLKVPFLRFRLRMGALPPSGSNATPQSRQLSEVQHEELSRRVEI